MERSIKHLLSTIRERSGIYIGNYSIIRLKSFLDGYRFAKSEAGEDICDLDTLSSFQQMVQERYSINSAHSWDNILVFMAGNEAKALDLFWELWDEHTSE